MNQNLKESKSRGSHLFPLEVYHTEDASGTFYVSCHWHPDIEILFLQEGSVRLFIDGRPRLVTKDAIVFINREELHCLNSLEKGTRYDALVFPPELLSFDRFDYCQQNYILPLIQKKLTFPALLTPDSPGYAAVREQFLAITRSEAARAPGYQVSVKASLLLLIACLIEHGLLTASQPQESASQAKRLDTMKGIVSYIQEHMAEKLSLEAVAAASFMTPNYFCKFFRRQFGQSFTRYLNGLRLEKACLLLVETDLPVMEISLQCGFGNLSYFIRLFKKEKGITPSEYRRQFLPSPV